MTNGISVEQIKEIPSCIKAIPGEEEEINTDFPATAPPYAILIAASSLSAWTKAPPTFGISLDMYSGISF
jgi:hypothetical protein